jgi:hypothetical protein
MGVPHTRVVRVALPSSTRFARLLTAALASIVVVLGLAPIALADDPPASGTSVKVTWTCTSSPCPWGPTDSAQALAWPASMGALSSRHGYTTSAAVYAPRRL